MKRMSVMMIIMMNSGLWILSAVILKVIGTKTMGENSCEVHMASDFGHLTLSSGCQSYTVKIRTSTELAFEVEVNVEPLQPNCFIEIKNENDHSVRNITDFPLRETIRIKGLNLAFQCPKTVSQLNVAWGNNSTLKTGGLSISTNRNTTRRADVSERSSDNTGPDNLDGIFDSVSKFELAAIGLGLCSAAVIASCIVACLCKRKRSNIKLKTDENKTREVEIGKDVVDDKEKTKIPEEQHPKVQMSVCHARKGSRRWNNPSGDYDQILDNLITPIDPKRLNEITGSGYVKMAYPPKNGKSDVENENTEQEGCSPGPALPDRKRKSSVRFHRISALLLGRKTGNDDNDYTNMNSHGSPLKNLKSVESFRKRGKRKFVKINKGKWLQDSRVWTDI